MGERIDRDKLSYDLALAFAKSFAEIRLKDVNIESEAIAKTMLPDFKEAYRAYMREPDSAFDLCVQPIDK